MNNKITVYTVKAARHYQFGLPADICLDIPAGIELTWVNRAEYELPEGYKLGTTIFGEKAIYNKSGHYCPLNTTNKYSETPVIIDNSKNPTFIKLNKIQDLPWEVI